MSHLMTDGRPCGLKDGHKTNHLSVKAVARQNEHYSHPCVRAQKLKYYEEHRAQKCEYQREYTASEHGQLVIAQYEASAARFMARIRSAANRRGNR